MATTGTVTSSDGTTIAYSKYGDGPALILVGGAFQHRAFDPGTAALAEALGEHFATYHYDRRGRGGSSDTEPYAIDREIEDIAAIIDAAGGSAYLHGHSSGGLLVLGAVEAGLPVPRISLYETTVSVDDQRPLMPADLVEQIRGALDAGDRSRAVETFLGKGVGVPAQALAAMKHAPMWPGFEEVANTLPYDAEICLDFVTNKPLHGNPWPGVTIPALVLNGGAGEGWMAAGADAIAAALPDAQRDTVPGQNHGPEAAVLAPVLIKFFS